MDSAESLRPDAVPMAGRGRPRQVGDGAILHDRLEEEVARSCRFNLPLACLVFRVREPGGESSSRLAHAAAVLARRVVRCSDVVGALGGEEFAIVANTGPEGAQVLANSLADELRALKYTHQGRALGIEVDCGIASLVPGKTPLELLEEARAALQAQLSALETRGRC